jgi:hypothetical protein
MISLTYDIKDFVESVKDKSYWDILTLLNQETTEAERMLYSRKTILADSYEKSKTYVIVMKKFITFLRYGVLSSKLSPGDVQLFVSVWRSLLERKEPGVPLRACPGRL